MRIFQLFFELTTLLSASVKDWNAIKAAAIELARLFLDAADGSPAPRSSVDYDAMTTDELCKAIEAEIPADGEGRSAALKGPVLDLLKPMFLALLKKILLGL